MEHTIAILILLGKAVLQEYAETPSKIGIKSTDYIIAKGSVVSDEISALLENFGILREVFEIFKNCMQAYKIM